MNEKSLLMPWGLKVWIWKINFCYRVLQLFKLPRCKERLQTAMCCLEWVGRFKQLVRTHPCHSFLPFEDVLGFNYQVVFVFHQCVYLLAISSSYAIGDIGGGAHEVISDLDGSFRSWHFLYIINERTSVA